MRSIKERNERRDQINEAADRFCYDDSERYGFLLCAKWADRQLKYRKEYMQAIMILDRLQCDLAADSPNRTPTSEECRERILKAMNELEALADYGD